MHFPLTSSWYLHHPSSSHWTPWTSPWPTRSTSSFSSKPHWLCLQNIDTRRFQVSLITSTTSILAQVTTALCLIPNWTSCFHLSPYGLPTPQPWKTEGHIFSAQILPVASHLKILTMAHEVPHNLLRSLIWHHSAHLHSVSPTKGFVSFRLCQACSHLRALHLSPFPGMLLF